MRHPGCTHGGGASRLSTGLEILEHQTTGSGEPVRASRWAHLRPFEDLGAGLFDGVSELRRLSRPGSSRSEIPHRTGRPCLTRSFAACAMAFQQVSRATLSRRASAATVVSCRSASTAQSMARVVSLARFPAKGCCSVHVCRGHKSSPQRQIRLNQRTRTGRPKQGASCSTWTLRPWPIATTPQFRHPLKSLGGFDVDTDHAVVVGVGRSSQDACPRRRRAHQPADTTSQRKQPPPAHTYSEAPSGSFVQQLGRR